MTPFQIRVLFEEAWRHSELRLAPFQQYKHLFSHGVVSLEFGHGWDNLFLDFLKYFDQVQQPDEVILQAKEKFAELRIYLSVGSDATDHLIAAAQKAASETCEVTGMKGAKVYSKYGWVKTLHPDTAAALGYANGVTYGA